MLIRHKKKTGGGFSKIVKMEDGTELNVNTNKCEGLWAHLKHKTKRIWNQYRFDRFIHDGSTFPAKCQSKKRINFKCICEEIKRETLPLIF